MRHHPALGEELLQGMPYLEAVRPLIRHHHERFDGEMTGEWRAYPDGVRGERLPLAARILRLAESVDGMLNERPYRPALPRDEVLRLLKEESGRSFDPRLTRLFLADEERLTRLGEVDAILEMLRENFI
jgi:HD-GYP domain-containing protein (c-di-GMP phosphodiesterase class II)